ncbi:FAD binding domain-containing protein [Nemania serpens]|nr:FAD binding domain-containing protein [Nemania serpens]
MAAVADQSLAASAADSIPESPSLPSIAPSLTYSEDSDDQDEPRAPEPARQRRASTRLISQSATDIQRITGESTEQLINRCCGVSCCRNFQKKTPGVEYEHIPLPDNDAFRSLGLRVQGIPTILTAIADVPEQFTFLEKPTRRRSQTASPADSGISLDSEDGSSVPLEHSIRDLKLEDLDTSIQPPSFVQPHHPYHVYPAKIHNTRELTKLGAEKRTFHILDLLLVPRFLRDKPVLLRTTKGRWLTWCSDIQSYPPTKGLLRTLAEYCHDPNEKKILMFLCSGEGQGVFCDFRTGPYISISQILSAFPSAKPPMEVLLSVLQPLMPRFYSLSNDPHESYEIRDGKQHRIIEVAVTVHDMADWRGGRRTGVGSGFFQRQAVHFLDLQGRGEKSPQLYIPMFKGLMANPLAKEFVTDGPMLLIGAGVGIAPFRGFVQRRLKSANCVNKVWVLQGIRDSLVDELYNGEWGVHEDEVKRVIQSRRGEGRYVQEEVINQADLVWYIINSVDGRVFVCGSSKGMGEGVEQALIEVAMAKGNLEHDEAKKFWELKKDVGQYITETW